MAKGNLGFFIFGSILSGRPKVPIASIICFNESSFCR